MLHVQVNQPCQWTVGRRELTLHLQAGMNEVDEELWDAIKKSSQGVVVERLIKEKIITEHYQKSAKITKKIVTNTYILADLEQMKEKTKSKAMLALIDEQIEKISLSDKKGSLAEELGLV